MTASRQRLRGKIVPVSTHVAIYQTYASPYWMARVWLPAQKKRVVRSTKTTVRIEAMKVAEEFARSLSSLAQQPAPRDTFKVYADRFLQRQQRLVEQGMRHPMLQKNDENHLLNPVGGLIDFFGSRDVKGIRTGDIRAYIDHLQTVRPEVKASSTFNHILTAFRKVMLVAKEDGVIDVLPEIPRIERNERPRAFFKFHPYVSRERDEYRKLLKTIQTLADNGHREGAVVVTRELYEFVLWQTHTFMRPTASEAFAVRFRDVQIEDNPRRLIITIADGKTGFRVVNSMPGAVSVFERLRKREHTDDDYIFMPKVAKRSNAPQYMAKMFRVVLKHAGLGRDEISGGAHTLYSLRHTSICMRIVNSAGKVNVFALAKNCGTSVDQIERFYARNLSPSKDVILNLQSMGEE